MIQGDVVLTAVPQANGIVKNRPAILLRAMRPFGDWLVCGISTKLNQAAPGFDEIISPDDEDFEASGLNSMSLIRFGFLSLVPSKKIAGEIGQISSERHQRLLKTLSNYLTASEG
jgi:mRNA interferase MazF